MKNAAATSPSRRLPRVRTGRKVPACLNASPKDFPTPSGASPAKYGIRGIPTLMIFKNGNIEATKVGALSKSQLAAFIDSNL